MSTVVLGVCASHATMYNTYFDKTQDQDGALRYRAGLQEGHRLVQEARPDAAIVIGSNHFRGFFLDLMPSFTICLGEVWGEGESGTPGGEMPVDYALGRSLAWGLQQREFDLALSLRQRVDHGVTQMLQFFTPQLDLPIVPLVINTFTPPLPTLRRSYEMGRAIRQVIDDDGQDRRIAVFASGGLSHALPFVPKWYDDLTDDQKVIVAALFQGAPQEEYDKKRIEIMRNATPRINADWDQEFLAAMETGELDAILDLTEEQLEEVAGNGGQELRSWLMAAGILGGGGRTLSYSALQEWHTGMGVAALFPDEARAAA